MLKIKSTVLPELDVVSILLPILFTSLVLAVCVLKIKSTVLPELDGKVAKYSYTSAFLRVLRLAATTETDASGSLWGGNWSGALKLIRTGRCLSLSYLSDNTTKPNGFS